MKTSKVNTGVIIVKASTNSEWDNCNFAVITIDDFLRENLPVWNEEAKKLKEKYDLVGFYGLTFWFDPEWGIDEDEDETDYGDKSWAWIEPDTEFRNPENKLRAGHIKLWGDGEFCISDTGEHTGEEFWTAYIKIDEILAL